MTDTDEFQRACILGFLAELGENPMNDDVWSVVARAIDQLGADRCAALCAKVRVIEEGGGLWTLDRRRRTKGGTFIAVLRSRYGWARTTWGTKRRKKQKAPPSSPEEAAVRAAQSLVHTLQRDGLPCEAAIEELKAAQRLYEHYRLGLPPPKPQKGARPNGQPPAFSWESRLDAVRESLAQKGSMTVTPTTKLMGRPTNVVTKGDCVVFSLEYSGAPSLPKGLPKPPVSVTYTVFVAAKQWKAVAAALAADPTDQVIVEGFAFWDETLETHELLAQSASTREIKRKSYADKPAAPKPASDAAPKIVDPPYAAAREAPAPKPASQAAPAAPPPRTVPGKGRPVEVEVVRRRPS